MSFRHGLLTAALVVLGLQTAGFLFLAGALVVREGWSAPVGGSTLGHLVLLTVGIPIGVLVGLVVLRRSFRKVAASETFFFAVFLFTLAAEALLLVQGWISLAGLSSFWTVALTRTVWSFRFTGLFFLFFGSLFAFGFAYRKYGILTLIAAGSGTAVALGLPLKTIAARNHLLFATGDGAGLVLVSALVVVVVLVNHAIEVSRREATWPRLVAAASFLAAWTAAIAFGPIGTLLAIPGVVFGAQTRDEDDYLG